MPDEILFFDSPVELQVRDLERREVAGRIVPYGEQIQIRGRPESFAQGALADVNPSTVKLLRDHDPKKPLGKMIALEERSDGAYAVFRVSKTQHGDEALELASDGVLSFSPGFYAGEQNRSGVHTRIRALPETSLVTFSAYSGSKVLSVREKEGAMPPETETEVAEVETRSEVDLGPIETRMEKIEGSLTKMESLMKAPAVAVKGVPKSLTPFNWFVAECRAEFSGKMELRHKMEEDFEEFKKRAIAGEVEWETRALADVTGGATQAGDNSPPDDLSGLVVSEFMGDQLVHVLNRRRPVFAGLGQMRMPRSGYADIPTVTQGTVVAKRAGQKQEANTQKLITTNASFKAEWLDGAVDVALEIIRTAELPVLEIVWNDLLGQYAKATELDTDQGAVSLIEAGIVGAVYTGSALATDTYANFIAAVIAQADVVEDASDAPATKLFLPRSVYNALVGLINPVVLEATGDQGGSAINLQSSSFVVPATGITAIKARSADLTAAVLTNEESLKVADSGPERVDALNVALMGHDIGLLGRTMFVPRIPGGIVVFGADPLAS